MPRLARLVLPKHPHHVVQRGVRSLPIFTGDADRETYLDFMREECARHGCSALAWCLMSNHVHLILVPGREESLGVPGVPGTPYLSLDAPGAAAVGC